MQGSGPRTRIHSLLGQAKQNLPTTSARFPTDVKVYKTLRQEEPPRLTWTQALWRESFLESFGESLGPQSMQEAAGTRAEKEPTRKGCLDFTLRHCCVWVCSFVCMLACSLFLTCNVGNQTQGLVHTKSVFPYLAMFPVISYF